MKNKTQTHLFVVVSNFVIATLIYAILVAEFAASLLIILAVVVALLVMDKYGIINKIFATYNRNKKYAIISGIIMALIVPVSLTNKNYESHIACMALIYAIACLGLNFQMGSTNMVNFAPAAFMGIGAYSVAITTTKLHLSPWLGMLFGMACSALFALLVGVPTLRTKGYYLSLVTMAVQLAFTQLLYNLPVLGGANGISGVGRFGIGKGCSFYKSYTIAGIKFAPQVPYLLLCAAFLIFFCYVAMRIYYSRTGLSLNMISQDDIAANCLGVNVANQKLVAFIIGGVFCGAAGALFAGLNSYVGPEGFNFNRSLMLICMVILGGMDNSIGVIVGAFLLSIISEKLRDFADYQQLVYGAILVITLIVRPNGLIPKRVRDYCGITGRTPAILSSAALAGGEKEKEGSV